MATIPVFRRLEVEAKKKFQPGPHSKTLSQKEKAGKEERDIVISFHSVSSIPTTWKFLRPKHGRVLK